MVLVHTTHGAATGCSPPIATCSLCSERRCACQPRLRLQAAQACHDGGSASKPRQPALTRPHTKSLLALTLFGLVPFLLVPISAAILGLTPAAEAMMCGRLESRHTMPPGGPETSVPESLTPAARRPGLAISFRASPSPDRSTCILVYRMGRPAQGHIIST